MRLFDVIKAHKNVPVDDPLAALLASSMGGWAVDTITGIPPIIFTSNGTPLTDYTILGNSVRHDEVQSVGERTNNLFDKAHFNFSDSTTIVYVPIYVGEGSFTLSTDLPASASGTRDVFFIGGNVSSGANSNYNGVDAAKPRTINSVDGYITVATRYNTSRENPADYHYMLNAGSEALPYEGYYKIPATVSDGTSSQTANIYLDEPLRKQLNGDAADEINYATQTLTRRVDENCDPLQTPTTESITLPTIPTINEQNTLTVDTTVQPSSVSITGHIKPVTS